jgi:hypothetical protein
MTLTMAEHVPVLTGGIPLRPTNDVDQARERKMRAEHHAEVAGLTDQGYVIIQDTTNAHPGRGTYQLLTYLLPPARER